MRSESAVKALQSAGQSVEGFQSGSKLVFSGTRTVSQAYGQHLHRGLLSLQLRGGTLTGMPHVGHRHAAHGCMQKFDIPAPA